MGEVGVDLVKGVFLRESWYMESLLKMINF